MDLSVTFFYWCTRLNCTTTMSSILPGKSAQNGQARSCPGRTGWAGRAGACPGWTEVGVWAGWDWMEKCRKAGGHQRDWSVPSPDRLQCSRSLLPFGSAHHFVCRKHNTQYDYDKMSQIATFTGKNIWLWYVRLLMLTQDENCECDVWCPLLWSVFFHNLATSTDMQLLLSSRGQKKQRKKDKLHSP